MPEPLAVLVPVKSFQEGKTRLADSLGVEERAVLAEKLATGVVQAGAPLPVFVACEDDAVASWAHAQGAGTIRSAEPGLNRVIRHGVATLAERGYERVLVAHADLADARNLPLLADWEGVVLVPDRQLDGTNALIIPAMAGFTFSYGPGSFARHLSEAERLRVGVHVIEDSGMSLDLDDADDLALFTSMTAEGAGLSMPPRER